MKYSLKHFVCIALVCAAPAVLAQRAEIIDSPERKEGEGPYTQLIIRNVTMIEGSLAPPIKPVHIVIENGRIKSIHLINAVGSSAFSRDIPKLKEGGREIDGTGMYVMPGLIDAHQHIGNNPEYQFKLDLAHGITTLREPGSGNGLNWVLKHKQKSAQNLITAPKIKAYLRFGFDPDANFNLPTTEEAARAWVRMALKAGADGIKDAGFSPNVIRPTLDEAKKVGLRVMTHHRQTMVARWNALDSARGGGASMEHWYGLPEAMFTNRTVQDFPANFDYQNEQWRFGEGGRLYAQTAAPFSEKWNAVMNEMLALDYTLDPTMVVYEKFRDYMRARTQEWLDAYAFPSAFERGMVPSKLHHGASLHDWTTDNETAWKEQFHLWMTFINEYKNRGGRVTTGSDDQLLYGFSLIRELELLQEAGFSPLEAVRAGTLSGAELLGIDKDTGSVEIGKFADLIVIDQNPLANFKVLYGTGHIRLMDDDTVARVGGVKYTIKEGIVYDARKLLADVKAMVDAEKAKTGKKIVQPGFKP
ncbi:MAG: amidohydrolase family protein [Pseudomonadota bacterium]